MKKYTAYKTTNLDWIGEYPNHWKQKRLKYLVTLINENAPENNMLSKIALENIESYSGRLINLDTEVEFVGEGKKFDKGDVLFNKLRPYLAKVYKATDKGICLGELLVLRPSCEMTSDFLFYRVISEPFISEVNSSTYGAKMPRASWDFIRNLEIPYPNIIEQNNIVEYLNINTQKIDNLIYKKQKLIDLLEEERIVIINQAVTKGIDPNVEMKDSGIEWLGTIPEHWKVDKIKHLFNLIKNPAPVGNNEKLISLYTATGVDLRENLEQRGNKSTTTDNYWLVKREDIIVNKLLAWMGAIGISEYEGVTSPAYDVIRVISRNKLNPYYYNYLFRLNTMSTEFKRYSKGILEMRLRLYFNHLGLIEIPVPPIEEQNKIIEYLQKETDSITSTITKIQKEIALLQEYRTALISEVVTGKVDVREEVAAWT